MYSADLALPPPQSSKAAPPAVRSKVDGKAAVLGDVRAAWWRTVLTFIFADLVTFALVATGTYAVAGRLAAEQALRAYEILAVVAPLTGLAYLISGLYNAASMHPAQEMRRIGMVTAVMVLSCIASAYLLGAPTATGTVLAVAGGLAVVVAPMSRVFFRVLFAQMDWWGVPVVVAGPAGRTVVRSLQRWPELGLRPVALFQDDALPYASAVVEDVPVLDDVSLLPRVAARHRIPYAILAMPGLTRQDLAGTLHRYTKLFKRVFVVSDASSVQALWTTAHSYDGLHGYGVQHYDRRLGTRLLKRALDLLVASIGLLLVAPLVLVAALIIKLDSPGPVFYVQRRMGREGCCFDVLKFRTMFTDADAKLEEILREDEDLRAEYEHFRKLRNDPRVTPIGRWLRRYSLDELPQLWNVIRGDMSMVGPRAYLPAELPLMNGLSRTVLQSPPGLTGLWQVSGRNALGFESRVDLDVHYMQNWSLWLDLYILARTVPVVLSGEGAS